MKEEKFIKGIAYGAFTMLAVCSCFIAILMTKLDKISQIVEKQKYTIRDLENENSNLSMYCLELEAHESPYGE